MYTSTGSSGATSSTSGETGIEGLAGCTPLVNAGEGLTTGAADFVGLALG